MNSGWLQRLAQLFRLPPGSPRPGQARPTFRPQLEWLEDRVTPATITVTTTDDFVKVDQLVSLREAIQSINAAKDTSDVVDAAKPRRILHLGCRRNDHGRRRPQ